MRAVPRTPESRNEVSSRFKLAAMIENRRQEIEQRWLTAAQAAFRKKANPSQLRDRIGDYLTRLAIGLKAGGDISLALLGEEIWMDVAKEHAVTRLHLGFDVSELVKEFILLRQVLYEIALEEKIIVEARHVDDLADLTEAAIAASVKKYVESRDYAARKVEAEHVAFVTHELRNPLTTAMMATSYLKHKIDLPPMLRRTFEVIQRSHLRLKGLIDSVLVTERFEAGQISVAPREFVMGEVMGEPLAALSESARSKDLEFAVSYDKALKLRIDPDLLVSAIHNLLENAIKYTEEGRVELTVDELPSEIMVHVRDTCGGISERELHGIFEPFRRGKLSVRSAGTGLGLAIARRAIEAQGGKMLAESPPGSGGCHFWFRVPKKVHKRAA